MTALDAPLAAAVFAAGGAGALLRVVLVARAAAFGLDAPWATLAVNVLGSAILGVLAGALPDPADTRLRLVLGGGLLGGFTTFSAFAVDTARLAGPAPLTAALLSAISVAATVAAAAAGLALGRALRSG